MLRITYPRKQKLLSTICSGKNLTNGHRWSQLIAKKLKQYFGDYIDIYGFGHKPLANKSAAIDPYVFSLVIENGSHKNYITEKNVDSLIGWSILIYFGANNVEDILGRGIPQLPFGCPPEEALNIIKQIVGRGGIDYSHYKFMREGAMKKSNLFIQMPNIIARQNNSI